MLDNVKEAFRNSTALMSFFSIFAGGMVFTMFSLIFGGDHDHGGDTHGDAGHGDSGDEQNQGPSLFSIRGLSLMATGFGACACLVMYYTKEILVSSVAGLAFGLVFAFAGITMMRIFIRQQASSIIQPKEFVGTVGEVTTSIPERGLGEVRLTVNGTSMSRAASSANGQSIRSGAAVRIVRSLGGTVSVEEVTSQ